MYTKRKMKHFFFTAPTLYLDITQNLHLSTVLMPLIFELGYINNSYYYFSVMVLYCLSIFVF